MTVRLLPLLLGLVALSGCDSSEPDAPSLTCEDVSLSSQGDLTASVPDGTFRANCFNVRSTDRLTINGFDVELDADPGNAGSPLGAIALEFYGLTPGTYAVGEDADPRVEAAYSPTESASFEATSGTATLSEFSPSRVRGTFSFQTANGTVVSEGSFDISL